MSIQNRRQLENTRKKLLLLEERCRAIEAEPRSDESGFAAGVTVRSLRKMIDQMKVEMAQAGSMGENRIQGAETYGEQTDSHIAIGRRDPSGT